MKYREIIKEIMEENKLSQQQLGIVLGVNQTTIGQCLAGKEPSFDSFITIYEKFGVTTNELFGIE